MEMLKEFWRNCNLELFTIGSCDSCSQTHYYPQRFCPHCGSEQTKLLPNSGEGRVLSYSHVMSSFYPEGYDFSLPYTVVMVKLIEGVQVVSKMDKYSPKISIGNQVIVCFEKRTDQKIPVFIVK
jgi:uncharacterized OB-fold protein